MKPTYPTRKDLASQNHPTSLQTSRVSSIQTSSQRSRDEQGKATSRQAVPASPELPGLRWWTYEMWVGVFGPGADSADNPRPDKPTEPEDHSNPPGEASSGPFIASGSVSMTQRGRGDELCCETSPPVTPPVPATRRAKK